MSLLGHDDVIIHSGKMMSCFILTNVISLKYKGFFDILSAICHSLLIGWILWNLYCVQNYSGQILNVLSLEIVPTEKSLIIILHSLKIGDKQKKDTEVK